MALEFPIAIFSGITIINDVNNVNDEWGRALCIIFCVAYGFFLIFVLFLFVCSRSPAKRMEEWEAKVGALFEGILYKVHSAYKFITVIFIAKRIAFAVCFFYLKYGLHILLFQLTTTVNVLFLCVYQPFEDKAIWNA